MHFSLALYIDKNNLHVIWNLKKKSLLKRKVLKFFLNVDNEEDIFMELLRLFQICGAEYTKLLPPKEIELILGFASKFLFPERRFLGGSIHVY